MGFPLVASIQFIYSGLQKKILAEFAIGTASFDHDAAMTSHTKAVEISGKCIIHKCKYKYNRECG